MSDPTRGGEPRETLQGDRLCTQCLHPLVGRSIERDAQTGLLFVRCGECGTASALVDYPTATPWMNRMKAVAASTLLAFFLVATIAVAAITGGFLGGAATELAKQAADALEVAHRPNDADPDVQQQARWYQADEAWLETAEGQRVLAAVRWAPEGLLMLVLIPALGSVIATPFLLLLGVALLRQRPLRRAIWGSLPALIGCGVSGMILLTTSRFPSGPPGSPCTWTEVANEAHLVFYAWLIGGWFVTLSATIMLIAPSLAASVARLTLPPRDRRLVAWLWEWRGKPVPRD
jgi:hypothetical protein